ncbi:hypothetical protein AVEN_34330-1 [Araneus ventricosus]|uniref:Uncharacterized protein n=1 Tax=Araneus ventricosus TaxID=182803 RepID=A0A4Y2G2F2_ARAVE|nr:hypothetical protein AVEN_34330-1 [Araneus ventricosus]
MRKYPQARDVRDRKFLRQRFTGLESEYQLKPNLAQREDWAVICENVTTDDPFGTHFDVAKNPDSRFFQLSTIEKQDGTMTSSTEETIAELLNFHFPQDQGQDSLSQARIRQASHTPLYPEDSPFSVPEIDAAFNKLKIKKAPGPDDL